MNTHVLPSLIVSVGLVVLPSIFVQAGDDLRAGGQINLSCPPMQYFVEPHFDVHVSPPAKGSNLFRYTYSIAFAEKEMPLTRIAIKGLADAVVESWTGDFDDCYITTGDTQASNQALSCWTKAQPRGTARGSGRVGTITLTSARGPGAGSYIAESATTTLLTRKLQKALLPFFNHDNALLTESLYDAIMEQCSSAAMRGPYDRAMTGAVTVPFYGDATVVATQPVEHASRNELSDVLARLRSSMESSAAGRDVNGERTVEVIDSSERRVVSNRRAKASMDISAKGPHPLSPMVHLDDVTSSCNVRALFVEVIRGGTIVDRHAIEIVRAKPCKFVQEVFKLDLPVSDSN